MQELTLQGIVSEKKQQCLRVTSHTTSWQCKKTNCGRFWPSLNYHSNILWFWWFPFSSYSKLNCLSNFQHSTKGIELRGMSSSDMTLCGIFPCRVKFSSLKQLKISPVISFSCPGFPTQAGQPFSSSLSQPDICTWIVLLVVVFP